MKYEKLNGKETAKRKKVAKWYKKKANRIARKKSALMHMLGRTERAESVCVDNPRGWIW